MPESAPYAKVMFMLISAGSKPSGSKGFTIVELMIALSVLSTILVMATAIMVQIGNLYSKGLNSANLQNTNRNIISDVSSALQFSGNPPLPCTETPTTCYADTHSGMYAFCIGTTRYSYVLNRELGNDNGVTTTHVLWRDTMSSNSACTPLDLSQPDPTAVAGDVDGIPNSTNGYEMMPEHMRLTKFKVVESPSGSGFYSVDVWMAFGDSDLVNTAADGSATCNSGAGTQYCALSNISQTVIRRIPSST